MGVHIDDFPALKLCKDCAFFESLYRERQDNCLQLAGQTDPVTGQPIGSVDPGAYRLYGACGMEAQFFTARSEGKE